MLALVRVGRDLLPHAGPHSGDHVAAEARRHRADELPTQAEIFWRTTLLDRNLSSASPMRSGCQRRCGSSGRSPPRLARWSRCAWWNRLSAPTRARPRVEAYGVVILTYSSRYGDDPERKDSISTRLSPHVDGTAAAVSRRFMSPARPPLTPCPARPSTAASDTGESKRGRCTNSARTRASPLGCWPRNVTR